ncbi:hypothetical protein [Paenibacillus radicis (ex Xue et al. 2023)]|uniref:P27 family phage terminase small subunit n=1 Tax=Paenibacillus radicis (ex Xue et al. 2023) TaxID=2972489 RepID=A0ABT1YRW5_9BACL|nr:hypothetical protein [Paenibacillus radicis (ex Xue et al. 2023)]MCR8635757.1 hypothetical protein [Paenibacillus radicis (ex Xue et al. 2023)]
MYRKEHKKLQEIFKEVEPNKAQLAEELINIAAFLKAENFVLMQSIETTGMVRINPKNHNQQEKLPSGDQLLKNINSYSVVIKTLNGILSKNLLDEDDEFDKFMRERRAGK